MSSGAILFIVELFALGVVWQYGRRRLEANFSKAYGDNRRAKRDANLIMLAWLIVGGGLIIVYGIYAWHPWKIVPIIP